MTIQKTTAARKQPAWELAELYPHQGDWSEDEYLQLDTNRLIEYSNGFLEFLPMPTTSHQLTVAYLYGMLQRFVSAHDLGTVLFAALRVRLWRGKFREPDEVFMAKAHADCIREEYWLGADLAVEVVSGKGKSKDRHRDLVIKRREYARAKISEYWIVDLDKERILVLRLSGKRYIVHGEYRKGAVATSNCLPGFSVDVNAVFGAPLKRARNGKR